MEIKEIRFKTKDKDISLSIEDAKKMFGLLKEIFGKPVVIQRDATIIIDKHEYPQYPYYPIRWYPDNPYPTWTSKTPYYAGNGTEYVLANNVVTCLL